MSRGIRQIQCPPKRVKTKSIHEAGVLLLEGVIDRLRIIVADEAAEMGKSLCHATLEEVFGFGFAAVPMARGDQLIGFGHEHGVENIGINFAQAAAQPDIEEVG